MYYFYITMSNLSSGGGSLDYPLWAGIVALIGALSMLFSLMLAPIVIPPTIKGIRIWMVWVLGSLIMVTVGVFNMTGGN